MPRQHRDCLALQAHNDNNNLLAESLEVCVL